MVLPQVYHYDSCIQVINATLNLKKNEGKPHRHPPQPNDFCKKIDARWAEQLPGKRGQVRRIGINCS